MKRTELEYIFRRLMDKLKINFRFRMYRSSKGKQWRFRWWKRVPGNPLNKNHVLDYNCQWPISSYQPGRIRKKFMHLHPELNDSTYRYQWSSYPDGKLEKSECYEIWLNNFSKNSSKDDIVFAVLSNSEFTSKIGIPCMTSRCQLEIYNDLIDIN